MPVERMHIYKYIPDRLYGFAQTASGSQVFFHLGAFFPGDVVPDNMKCANCSNCTWAQSSPPPILGEEVDVTYEEDLSGEGRAPRADKVVRLTTPVSLQGIVETFDPYKGYGFIKGSNGMSYHLHKSEVVEGRLPLKEMQVKLYVGIRMNKPRACYVKVCP